MGHGRGHRLPEVDGSQQGVFHTALLRLTADELASITPDVWTDPPLRRSAKQLIDLDPVRVSGVPRHIHRRLRGFKRRDLGLTAFLISATVARRHLAVLWPAEGWRPTDAAVAHVAEDMLTGGLTPDAVTAVLAAAVFDGTAAHPAVLDLMATDTRFAVDGAAEAHRGDLSEDLRPFDPFADADEPVGLTGLAERFRAYLEAPANNADGVKLLVDLLADVRRVCAEVIGDIDDNRAPPAEALEQLGEVADVIDAVHGRASDSTVEAWRSATVELAGPDWTDPALVAVLRCSWAVAEEFTDLVDRLRSDAAELLAGRIEGHSLPSEVEPTAPVAADDVDAAARPYVAVVQAADAYAQGDRDALQAEIRNLAGLGGGWAQLAAPAAVGLLRFPTASPDTPDDEPVDANEAAVGDYTVADESAVVEATALSAPPDDKEESFSAGDVVAAADASMEAALAAADFAVEANEAAAEEASAEAAEAAETVEIALTGTPVSGDGPVEIIGPETVEPTPAVDVVAEATDVTVAKDAPASLVGTEPAAAGEPEEAVEPEEEDDAAAVQIGFDDDPHIAEALNQNLLDLLSWYAEIRDEDPDTIRHARLVALGSALRSPTSALAERYRTEVTAVDGVAPYRSLQLLAYVTGIRTALLAPGLTTWYTQLQPAAVALDHPDLTAFFDLVQKSAWANQSVTSERVRDARGAAQAEQAVVDAAAAARSLRNHAHQLSTSHVATTQVWESLLTTSGSPVADALAAAADDARDKVDAVRDRVLELRKADVVDDLAREHDPRPAGEPAIHSSARRWLQNRLDDVADAAGQWVDAIAELPTASDTSDKLQDVITRAHTCREVLLHALKREITASPHATVVAAARVAHRHLTETLDLLKGTPLPTPASDPSRPDEAAGASLLRCPGLVIDDFTPVNVEALQTSTLRTATTGTWTDAYERHATAGNIVAARACIQRAPRRDQAALEARLDDLYTEAVRRYHRTYDQVVSRFHKTRVAAALGDQGAADIDRQLTARHPDHLSDDANIAVAEYRLRKVSQTLDAALGAHRENLLADLDQLLDPDVSSPEQLEAATAAARQIRRRIDSNDLGEAAQMIHAARRGDAFTDHTVTKPSLGTLHQRAAADDPLTDAVPDGASADARQAAERAVEAWTALRQWPTDRDMHTAVRQALTMFGVTVAPGDIATPMGSQRGPSHQWREVIPTDVTRSAAIHSFDLSKRDAARWRTLVVRNDPSYDRVAHLVADDESAAPVIILHTGTVSRADRTNFAQIMRTSPARAVLLVDSAVVADLAAHEALRDFEALAQRTLPYCNVNPYLPEGRESLPDVLFYGRESELAEILRPMGSLFVYGGRQLGKSALLSQAGRQFRRQRPGAHLAIHLMVKRHLSEMRRDGSIVLLHHIADELRKAGVPVDTGGADPAMQFISGVTEWLDGDDSRRILLLLDECDDFWDIDFLNGGFPAVTALKTLMERTERRVKPVFAGLHQVQRFAKATNHPFAHFGRPIQVGILAPEVAPQLLTEPLYRLGFSFAKPDRMIWRILQEANYQPGILQVIGRELVDHMVAKPVKDDEPPYLITTDDIEAVLSSAGTVNEIRQRFSNTVGLDHRYLVIANVMCLLAAEEGLDHTVDAAILRQHCASYWPQGFTGSPEEFVALLDEMVGLGVLATDPADDGRYMLFSPRITTLLGGVEKITERLLDTSDLTLSEQFSARHERRIIDKRTGEFSPLPEQVLSSITTPRSHTMLIAGTAALGMDAIPKTLKEMRRTAPTATFEVTTVAAQKKKVAARLEKTTRSDTHRIVVIDLKSAGAGVVEEILDLAAEHTTNRNARHGTLAVVVLAGPQQERLWTERITDPSKPSTNIVVMRRYDDPSLRLWRDRQDIAVDADSFAVQTMAATGGWPGLLQRAWARWTETGQWSDALDTVTAEIEEHRDTLLVSADLHDDATRRVYHEVADWDGDAVTFEDLVAVCECDDTDAVRRRLRRLYIGGALDLTDGRLSLDPVTRKFLREVPVGA